MKKQTKHIIAKASSIEIRKEINEINIEIRDYQELLKDPIKMEAECINPHEIHEEIRSLKKERMELLNII